MLVPPPLPSLSVPPAGLSPSTLPVCSSCWSLPLSPPCVTGLSPQVLKNPMVFMVLVGLVSHLALGQRIPLVLGQFIDGLADSFGGAALFYLGLTMVGAGGAGGVSVQSDHGRRSRRSQCSV